MFVLVAVFGSILGTGVKAAFDARDQASELEDQLNTLSPLELTQPDTYLTLGLQFEKLERTMGRAHSRLSLLKPFQWVPGLGPRISEALTLADIGKESASMGRNVSITFQGVWGLPLDTLAPDDAVSAISGSLQNSTARLQQAEAEARRVRDLRGRLKDTGRGAIYGPLIDQYLPLAQAVLYLSRTTPETVGNFYLLYRELSVLRQWADDPLSVMEIPGEVRRSLKTLDERSFSLTGDLDLVILASQREPEKVVSEDTRDALRLFKQQLALLRRVSRGVDALVNVWQTATTKGFLSKEFALVTEGELERAKLELRLAKLELDSLQTLLDSQEDLTEALAQSALGSRLGSLAVAPGRFDDSLAEITNFAGFLSSFLAYDEPKTYLLIGQNPTEIRATGGFIGVVVSLELDRGEIKELVYYNSTEVDPPQYATNPPAPEALFWYLWMERMTFRDSNWDPHFPTSAAQIAEIFNAGQGKKIDGVVATTKTVMADLVELFGDVTVPGISGPLDRETAAAHVDQHLSYPCRPDHSSDLPDRCFDEDLFFALWDRLQKGDEIDKGRDMAQMFRRQVGSKDLLIHLFDGKAGAFLWEQGWNGVVRLVDHDYLMLVDSSLPGHTSEGVQRSWEYNVALNLDGPMEAELRVRYKNSNPPYKGICRQAGVSLFGCFPNYLRVLVAPGAQDIQAPPIPLHEGTEKLAWGYTDLDTLTVIPQPVSGLTEIAGFLTIEPSTSLTVPIAYRLDQGILRSTAKDVYEYRLFLQKQPGMGDESYTVAVQLPPGTRLNQVTPEPTERRGRWVIFNGNLLMDTTLVVSFNVD